MDNFNLFKGRKLLIATKHEKEKVIAPILEAELGVKCFISSDFDTDELGTFTGEIERKHNPITTARNKCLKAMELTNADLALASEGSFGNHPSIFFASANEEILILYDKKNDFEIIVKELSKDTNFQAAEINTEHELKSFITNAKFPSHGLILRKSKDDFNEIVKGIIHPAALQKSVDHFIATYGKVYIETDMRAMYNPTRMNVIEEAAIKLANKINSLCPQCNFPGFGVTDFIKGLPCDLCKWPTKGTLSYVYTCQKCSFSKEEKYPNNKTTENPMYCDYCNP